ASFNPRGSAAGNIGLGFAIPVDLARNVMQQLASTGTVQRGTLGLDTQAVDARLASGLGLPEARGVVVTRLHGDSSAAAAGLRTGDVIISANGQRMDDPVSLRNFQGLQPLDAPVTLEVLRDGKPLTITARLRAQPRDGASYDARLAGATLSDLPEAVRRQNPNARGVLVEKVEDGSRAHRNGLREGDYIFAANAGEFRDLAGFRDSLSDRPERLVLRISRGRSVANLIMQSRRTRADPPRLSKEMTTMSSTSTDAMKNNLGQAGAHLKNAATDAGSAIKNAASVAGEELRMGRSAVKADLADSALAGIAALEEG